MTTNDPWFKMPMSTVFNPTVTNLSNDTFRVYVHLLAAFAHRKAHTLTEEEFLLFTPVRSWRVHLRKLVEAGLVEWDTQLHIMRIPTFTELNGSWIASQKRAVKTVRKPARAVLPKADTSYEYDFEYVSNEW